MDIDGRAVGRMAVIGALYAAALTGCAGLSPEEAQRALEEAQLVSETEILVTSAIEAASGFVLGGSPAEAAEAVRVAIEAELPCADVTAIGARLSIAYGALPGGCTRLGLVHGGAHVVEILDTGPLEARVEHTFMGFRSPRVSVTGSARVRFDGSSSTRQVHSELTATRLDDGHTTMSRGDRRHAPLAAGLASGFQVDGERSWTTEEGAWALVMEGAELRFADTVPQAGRYTLETPFGRRVGLVFERASSFVIRAVVDSGAQSYTFEVVPALAP